MPSEPRPAGGDLLHHGRDHVTRSAPLGPEVHQDGTVRLQDLPLEGPIAHMDDVSAHRSISFARRDLPTQPGTMGPRSWTVGDATLFDLPACAPAGPPGKGPPEPPGTCPVRQRRSVACSGERRGAGGPGSPPTAVRIRSP